MLQLSIESLDNHHLVITHCAHISDNQCISRIIETQHKCPMCRAELEDRNCLVRPATGSGETSSKIEYDIDTSSSKVEALIGILKASAKKSTGLQKTETTVFSQWTKFLDVVQKQLTGFRRDPAKRRRSLTPSTLLFLLLLINKSNWRSINYTSHIYVCDLECIIINMSLKALRALNLSSS